MGLGFLPAAKPTDHRTVRVVVVVIIVVVGGDYFEVMTLKVQSSVVKYEVQIPKIHLVLCSLIPFTFCDQPVH